TGLRRVNRRGQFIGQSRVDGGPWLMVDEAGQLVEQGSCASGQLLLAFDRRRAGGFRDQCVEARELGIESGAKPGLYRARVGRHQEGPSTIQLAQRSLGPRDRCVGAEPCRAVAGVVGTRIAIITDDRLSATAADRGVAGLGAVAGVAVVAAEWCLDTGPARRVAVLREADGAP